MFAGIDLSIYSFSLLASDRRRGAKTRGTINQVVTSDRMILVGPIEPYMDTENRDIPKLSNDFVSGLPPQPLGLERGQRRSERA